MMLAQLFFRIIAAVYSTYGCTCDVRWIPALTLRQKLFHHYASIWKMDFYEKAL